MRYAIRLLVVVPVLLAFSACGITGNLRYNPGYAAFSSPGMFETDRELGLSVGPLPLMIARQLTADDPELAAMLDGLKAVRVYIYAVDGDAPGVNRRLEATRARLIGQGWEPVVAVREDGGFVSAQVRTEGGSRVRGMAVMVHDDDEVVFVNLIGDLRPEMFSAIVSELELELDIPHVEIGADACAQCVSNASAD